MQILNIQKGLSIFHRFVHQVSYKKFNRQKYIAICLFLSAKDNDIFNWSVKIMQLHQLSIAYKKDGLKIENDDQNTFKIISEKIIDTESHILQMIGYNLNIIVPQLYFKEAKTKLVATQGGIKQLIEFSQKYLSDIFLNNACLQYETIIILFVQQIWLAKYEKQQQQICQIGYHSFHNLITTKKPIFRLKKKYKK